MYRDMVEPNFPGVVWIHMGVRSLFGWSTEALRSFDLVLFSFIVILLARFIAAKYFQLSFVLVLMYYSVSEWCHVQRDVWLLIPAVAGISMRYFQIQRISNSNPTTKSIFFHASLEGLIWGAGIWIKPHLVIPALAVWICSLFMLSTRRGSLKDLVGLLTGGLIVGAMGIAWLISSTSWPWFLEMQLEWNREYLSSGSVLWNKGLITNLGIRLFPYWLVHLFAIPTALITLFKMNFIPDRPNLIRLKLLATLYLAWCLQVLILQHPFDYIHVPPLLLGIAFMTLWFHCARHNVTFHKVLAYSFVCLALYLSPALKPEKIMLWSDCLKNGSTNEIRNQLAQIPFPDWKDLERVGEFLEQQKAGDYEVTCHSNDLVHLYRDLNLEPSTRYVYSNTHTNYFPSKRSQIKKTLLESQQRFVLTNLMSAGLFSNQAKENGPLGINSYPPAFPKQLQTQYPWNLPIAFRSGTLVVHRTPGNAAATKPHPNPKSPK
ncbi:MAG: hypothetical protein K0U86_13940 [Planctomycetes bacterium]|nr:hypothetical protein [Planctomycetota bacterium]MCH9725995.1 hypothetical protein [Planctomycetota bacterium]MCH9777148.1 hypothetical protein [Planctomycetota bacterium]MCH9790871.1 hypothetical protein [Planctomycetota bacterium]